MNLFLDLLAWIVGSTLLAASLGLFFRRHAVEGTLASPDVAFTSPTPGSHYYRLRERRGENVTQVVEHFTVSVPLPREVRFELVSRVPPALSAAKLTGYSDDLFKRLFAGYVKFKEPVCGFPPNRAWQTALVMALSAVPHSARGTLIARQGRLVLQWARDYDENPSKHTITKDIVLAKALRELEQFAESLRVK